MDLYISGRVAEASSHADKGLQAQLEEVWGILYSIFENDRGRWLEAKAWFISTIAGLSNLSAQAQRACFLPFLRLNKESSSRSDRYEKGRFDRCYTDMGEGSEGRGMDRGSEEGSEDGDKDEGDKDSDEHGALLEEGEERPATIVCQQMLQVACELAPKQMASVLMESPEKICRLFEGSDAAILLWFSHFSMEGMPRFKYGARALAHYALSHRDEVWHLLAWEGKHPQAPATVAMKTHYFCEINVLATVRALLKSCPGFWSSDIFQASLADGQFITLSPQYFVQALQETLEEAGSMSRRLLSALETFISQRESWRSLCHRLIHYMTQDELLHFISTLASNSPQLAARCKPALPDIKDVAGQGWQSLSGLLLMPGARRKAIRWRNLTEVLLMHALCCARPQLQSLLKDDNDDELTKTQLDLLQLCLQIHGTNQDHLKQQQTSMGHRLLLVNLRCPLSSRSSRKTLALEAWTLYQALLSSLQPSDQGPSASALLLISTAAHYDISLRPLSSHKPTSSHRLPAANAGLGSEDHRDGPNMAHAACDQTVGHPSTSSYQLLSSSSADDDGHPSKQQRKSKKRSNDKGKHTKKSRKRSRRRSNSSRSHTSCSEGDMLKETWNQHGSYTWPGDEDAISQGGGLPGGGLGSPEAPLHGGGREVIGLSQPGSFLLQCGGVSMSCSAEDAADFLAMYACKHWATALLNR